MIRTERSGRKKPVNRKNEMIAQSKSKKKVKNITKIRVIVQARGRICEYYGDMPYIVLNSVVGKESDRESGRAI